jgi:hypothetical protein
MIAAVDTVWKEYPHQCINHMWLSIQANLNAILEHHGSNEYDVPHMSKMKLEREKKSPMVIMLSRNAMDLVEDNYDPDFANTAEGIAQLEESNMEYKNATEDDLPDAITAEELASLLE